MAGPDPLRRAACGAALAALFAAPAAAAAPGPGLVSQEAAGGVHAARLETPAGSIYVYLPDDLAAGDTISGTVSYAPSGKTDVEREQNLGELRGYVVEVAGEPPAEGPTWVRVLRQLPGPTIVRFLGPRGAPIGEASIPTLSAAERPPQPPSFEVPVFGQAGNPVAIGGPVSGAPDATRVTIGGRDAPFLAQSPRKTLVRAPTDVVGPTEIRIERDGAVAEAPFRVLAVQVSADKLDLRRGERTTLHLEVGGLAGLDEPVPLSLTNRSPEVVRLGTAEVERLTIRPQDVAADGTYRLDRPILSLRSGAFAVNAEAGPARRTSLPVLTRPREEKPPA